VLHVFSVHLVTAFLERRDQRRKLLTSNIPNNCGLRGTRIVQGGFNASIWGLAARLLTA
jgi:endonuclease/exonuclease/phosphatase (EEP) superfamily protein YafD